MLANSPSRVELDEGALAALALYLPLFERAHQRRQLAAAGNRGGQAGELHIQPMHLHKNFGSLQIHQVAVGAQLLDREAQSSKILRTTTAS